MSKDLGYFSDNDAVDYPDLNKCPDCETFFAERCCPLCGKECPEEYRAGNRKRVKVKKHRTKGSRYVQFVPWDHSTWFIVIMLFFQPLIGLILTWTGVWKTGWKVLATVLTLFGWVFGALIGFLLGMLEAWISGMMLF